MKQTPREIIERIAPQLSRQTLLTIDHEPTEPALKCHSNVIRRTVEKGGTQIYGWKFGIVTAYSTDTEPNSCLAVSHSVWRDESGRMVDITRKAREGAGDEEIVAGENGKVFFLPADEQPGTSFVTVDDTVIISQVPNHRNKLFPISRNKKLRDDTRRWQRKEWRESRVEAKEHKRLVKQLIQACGVELEAKARKVGDE
ncbi:MAG: hypothetical protein WCL32_07795 [Planctomycetota bacterium]